MVAIEEVEPEPAAVEEEEEEDDLSELQNLELDSEGHLVKSFRRRGHGKLRPAEGEPVTVHVVGTLEDGTVFASTREEHGFAGGEPLVFTVGDTTVEGRMDVSDIPSGLNEGVVTMARGEIASFKLAPEKAHGDAGLSTGDVEVPAGATVVYEVELLSWAQDLQKDGGLLLTRAPAVAGQGCHVAGATGVLPTDLTTVRMRYTVKDAATNAVIEDCSSGDGVTFIIDDGHVMLGLELAAKQLRGGEKATLIINTKGETLPYGYSSLGPGHPVAPGSLSIDLELLPFESSNGNNLKGIEDMSSQEKLTEVERIRKLGVAKFKIGEFARARRRFEKALTVATHRTLNFNFQNGGLDKDATEEEAAALTEHRAALSNNVAACCLKLEEWEDVLTATVTTLQIKPEDTKALYRRGLAHNRLGSFDRAKSDLKKASKLEGAKEKPDKALVRLINKEFNGVTSQGLEKQKEKEKDVWGGKFKAAEPGAPVGIMAKAAAAVGMKPKGGGESPLSPKKKKKNPAAATAAAAAKEPADAVGAGAGAGKEKKQVQKQQKKPGVWFPLLQKVAPAAAVLIALLVMALRRRR